MLIFQVTSSSRVTSNRNRYHRLNIEYVDLPATMSAEDLATWTRQRFSALTSLTSVSSANSIVSIIGAGMYCICNLSSLYFIYMLFVYFWRRIETNIQHFFWLDLFGLCRSYDWCCLPEFYSPATVVGIQHTEANIGWLRIISGQPISVGYTVIIAQCLIWNRVWARITKLTTMSHLHHLTGCDATSYCCSSAVRHFVKLTIIRSILS